MHNQLAASPVTPRVLQVALSGFEDCVFQIQAKQNYHAQARPG
jgi:hypothetical protein